jgi:hypothetical protein
MAWTQQERAWWRHFLGFSAIFKQADPRLENAVTAISSIADGGTQPDSTTENYARTIIQDALAVEALLKNLWLQMQVSKSSGGNVLDALRGMMGLRQEGRRIVNSLSAIISTNPRRDVFSAAYVNSDGDAYITPGGQSTSNW